MDRMDNKKMINVPKTKTPSRLKKRKQPEHHRDCVDYLFVSNFYCYDGCVEAPINPDINDASSPKTGNTVKKQLKKNIFFYLTVVLLCLFNSLFVYYTALYLARQVHWSVLAISQWMFGMVLLYMIATACTDPGIFPRTDEIESNAIQRQLGNEWNSNEGQILQTRLITINDQPIWLKYCYTCRFYRPPRASHCSTCNRCIDRFDHHCPWIGNCVGRRNYRSFYQFLLWLSNLAIFTSACAIAQLVIVCSLEPSLTEAFRKFPFPLIYLLVVMVINWSVLGLAGFHTYLVMANLTTNEDIKGTFVTKIYDNKEWLENPYTKGSAYLNCRQVLCSPIPPSFLK